MLASKFLEQIQALIDEHGDKHIILQGDQEGNYYSELAGIERTFYEDDCTADCREEAGEDAQEVFVVYP